mmetsp:Transcript_15601/g.17989  ORF Transcript_15601/g.17989 Transcript_15601/m.17989 type:complete len:770 (+) Transcript_15601:88-2397(+)|eukprot:CAMPEP_0176446940 /NCGR_PEP_ID=MMETSP0127-20121128/24680_1 /TAXON_ID=938130 /ORGANISM="Platyophrya macrostoma, Strain WH" /LENGTH=769 /DNA_ID=CAMNT_0017833181 /DNA_START=85 /DNA_END=2394 /DNA_ORIENTATION=+
MNPSKTAKVSETENTQTEPKPDLPEEKSIKEPSSLTKIGQAVQNTAQNWSPALRVLILLCISLMAILVRVFSVLRYESIIHEFDPWFNYRTTRYLVQEGPYSLWNWFDHESWYPLGRSVGPTLYPGLMGTAGLMYWGLKAIGFPVDIRNVCVFTGPIFAAFAAIVTYLMTKEITRKSESGLFAALFISVVPSYISRSVAGSYDNEAVAIFALIWSFHTFLKACNSGSILSACWASIVYFYMVSTWGGYAFIINIIPIFVVFLLLVGKFDVKIYVAYSIFYVLGTLFAMQIQFVAFQALSSSEHLASHCVFFLIQAYMLIQWARKLISKSSFNMLIKFAFIFTVGILVFGFIYLTMSGKTKWSGRSMTLLDPTYAKKHNPIVSSVSEHQATTWTKYFSNLHITWIFTPVGIFYCFKKPTPLKIFAVIYVILAAYFSSVMIRLLLVLAPAMCVVGGIGASATVRFFVKSMRGQLKGKYAEKRRAPFEIAIPALILVGYLITTFISHSIQTSADTMSSPSVVLGSRRRIIDDYREAYYWLRRNTKPDARIMSWWDYGYQIAGLGNRTVIVDNNTWNNSHIATVGLAMSSNEEYAYEICEFLHVDYVLVIFGAHAWYSSDDIGKFLWMVRIAGGVYPHIKESSYVGNGGYQISSSGTQTMLNCLLYKLCYYRFGEVSVVHNEPRGYDPMRKTVPGNLDFELRRFQEAFSSNSWIVRIYRVLPRKNRESIKMLPRKLDSYPASDKLETFKNNSMAFVNFKYEQKIGGKRQEPAK